MTKEQFMTAIEEIKVDFCERVESIFEEVGAMFPFGVIMHRVEGNKDNELTGSILTNLVDGLSQPIIGPKLIRNFIEESVSDKNVFALALVLTAKAKKKDGEDEGAPVVLLSIETFMHQCTIGWFYNEDRTKITRSDDLSSPWKVKDYTEKRGAFQHFINCPYRAANGEAIFN